MRVKNTVEYDGVFIDLDTHCAGIIAAARLGHDAEGLLNLLADNTGETLDTLREVLARRAVRWSKEAS